MGNRDEKTALCEAGVGRGGRSILPSSVWSLSEKEAVADGRVSGARGVAGMNCVGVVWLVLGFAGLAEPVASAASDSPSGARSGDGLSDQS